MRSNVLGLLAAAALHLPCTAGAAGTTVAVLSSAGGAYLQAFSAFQAEYGSEVSYMNSSREKVRVPPGTGTVVTFGVKAMTQEYPGHVNIVSCLAPGYFIGQQDRPGQAVKISMLPSLPRLIATIKRIQPRIKRLRVFWMVESYRGFQSAAISAGEEAGVEITTVKVSALYELPALLRAARGKMDAFFLPPDPLLISQESLMIFREFSWSNGIPMYASTKGIAKDGATAAIGIGFAESGAAAARAAKALHSGKPQPAVIFPEKIELTLNATAARKCGVQLSSDLLKEAAVIFQ